MAIKIPTIEDYRTYDGAHTYQLWNGLSDSWSCPGCGRTKFEIMRWTTRYFKRGIGKCSPYKGWMAGLHRHHDHAGEYGSSFTRFSATIICDQCNSSDGCIKKQLKLPQDFSFSPEEIRQFVTSSLHGRHRIDLAKAQQVYESLTSRKGNGVRCSVPTRVKLVRPDESTADPVSAELPQS
jgi:hypothetical protein